MSECTPLVGAGALLVGSYVAYENRDAIGQAFHNLFSKSDGSNNAAPPATSQNQSQSQSTPADPNQGKPEKEGAQDKKLTKDEINNLKENTGQSAEEIKQETMGTKKVGNLEMYKNDPGDIVVKPKGSSGAGEPTGYTTEDLKPPEPKPE